MTTYESLPPVEREVLRQVYRSPEHVASKDYIIDHCYYPNAEVEQAINELVGAFHLVVIKPNPDPRYVPSREMLSQMKAKTQAADAELLRAIHQAKPYTDGDDQ